MHFFLEQLRASTTRCPVFSRTQSPILVTGLLPRCLSVSLGRASGVPEATLPRIDELSDYSRAKLALRRLRWLSNRSTM